MQDKHLTINDLAPLLDSLVAEITVAEHGKCESRHEATGRNRCTVVPVGIVHFSCCDSRHRLACRTVCDYVAEIIAIDGICVLCDRPTSDCWSVVVLP